MEMGHNQIKMGLNKLLKLKKKQRTKREITLTNNLLYAKFIDQFFFLHLIDKRLLSGS